MIGKRLKEFRKKTGLGRLQAAEFIDLNPTNYSKLENGHQNTINSESLKKFALKANMTPEDLYYIVTGTNVEGELRAEIKRVRDELARANQVIDCLINKDKEKNTSQAATGQCNEEDRRGSLNNSRLSPPIRSKKRDAI